MTARQPFIRLLAPLVAAAVLAVPALAGATAVSGPSVSKGTYTLTWTKQNASAKVELQERLAPSGTWAQVQKSVATSKPFSKTAEADWEYRARECETEPGTPEMCGSFGAVLTVKVRFAPTVPGSLGAEVTDLDGSYALAWAASSGTSQPISYTLEEKIGSGAWTALPAQTATSKSFTAKPDAVYVYRVKACTAFWCSATTATKQVNVLRVPTMPINVDLPASSTTGNFSMTWSASTQTVDHYELERRVVAPGTSFAYYDSTPGYSTFYAFFGHGDGDFEYRVRACNAMGCSLSSNAAPVHVLKTPLPPGSLGPEGENQSGRYTVAWTASPQSTVATYELQTREGSGPWTTASLAGDVLSRAERRTVAGDFSYQVRACNATGCSGYTGPKTVNVRPQFPAVLTDAPIVVHAVPAQAAVGTLPGQGGVEGGAASYTVTLPVPPGRRGVEPHPTLAYGSKNGNGEVGVGWTIDTGARAIYRCPSTLAQDDLTRAVDFSDNDKLCLDGQRLIKVAGTYGASGSEYRTELDSFARIKLLGGGISSAASYFRIEEKSGNTIFLGNYGALGSYGEASGAYVPPGTTRPLRWKQRVLQDPQGNSIVHSYKLLAGEHLLSAIEYTGTVNTSGHTYGSRRVQFVYDSSRNDGRVAYLAGAELRSQALLTGVSTWIDQTLVRWYALDYGDSAATGRKLLASVTACSAWMCLTGPKLPPTTFTYHAGAVAFETTHLLPPYSTTQSYGQLTLLEDFDGDGVRDSLYRELSKLPNTQVIKREVHLSNLHHATPDPIVDITTRPWLAGFDNAVTGWPDYNHDTDFDRDGIADLEGVSAGKFAVGSPTTGEPLKTSNLPLTPADGILQASDFDGDGKTDLLVSDGSALRWYSNHSDRDAASLTFATTPITPYTLVQGEKVVSVMDLDGDGLLDIVIDRTKVLPGGTGYPKVIFAHRAASSFSFEMKTMEQLGGPPSTFTTADGGSGFFDANGDGLPDIYRMPRKFWINRGGTFQALPEQSADLLPSHLWGAIIAMDYDGDGADELMVPRQLMSEFCYATQNSLEETIYYCGDLSRSSNGPTDRLPWSVNGHPVHEYDRSIYRWDALRVRSRQLAAGEDPAVSWTTPMVAPIYEASVEDHSGDGLPDLRYQVAPLYGWDGEPAVYQILGQYFGGISLPIGWNVAHNLGAGSLGIAADELAEATTGVGARTRWAYAPLSSAGHPACDTGDAVPFYRVHRQSSTDRSFRFASSMQVVARMSQEDGIGGVRPTCYRYEDAMESIDGRGFLGFRVIHVEDDTSSEPEDNLRTTSTFDDTEFPLVGKLLSERTEKRSDVPGSGNPIELVTQDWSLPSCTGKVCRVFVKDRVETSFDLATRTKIGERKTHTVRTGNDLVYGNDTSVTETVSDTEATYKTETTQSWNYGSVDSQWQVAQLDQRSVRTYPSVAAQAPFLTADLNPERWVTTVFSYYPATDPARRLVELTQTFLGPGGPRLVRSTGYEYNASGATTLETVSAEGLQSGDRKRRWGYSPDGYFVTSETNAKDQVVTRVTNADTGTIASRNDFGVVTTYSYDPLGRLVEESTPGQPVVHHRLATCNDSCTSRGVYRELTIQDGAPARATVVDRLGREIATRLTGFAGKEVVTTRSYDARGRLVLESVPTEAGQVAAFTRYGGYDALGRPADKTIDRLGQTPSAYVVRYAYAGASTDITLPDGTHAFRRYDLDRRVTETTDALGGHTSYRYDGRGDLALLRDAKGGVMTAHFDELGRRLDMSDPNRGTVVDAYDGLDELVSETTAADHLVEMRYDALGRLIQRKVDGVADLERYYDNVKPGLLDLELAPSFRRDFTYDALRRPLKVTTAIDGHEAFVVEHAYDGYYGREKGTRYPGGDVVGMTFDDNGYATSAYDPLAAGADFVFKTLTGLNPRGQVTGVQLGNGLSGSFEYFDATGQAKRFRVQGTGGVAVMDQSFAYEDDFMNLTRRENALRNVVEWLDYDSLQRLTQAQRVRGPASETITFSYDALGNFTSKSDFGTAFGYGNVARTNHNAGPSAVASVTRPDGQVVADFEYDLAGNMRRGLGRTIDYSAFDQPLRIESGGHVSTFEYTPDLQRMLQVSGTRTTYYLDNYELVVDGGQVEERTYVATDLLLRRVGAGAREVRYIHRDPLGSVDTITDEEGAIVEAHGFDAFGKPLSSDWRDVGGLLHSGEFAEADTNRGFSDHEHLDDHGLIHMTGRAYDPALGRFLSADPLVQNIKNSQSLNPYSYVMNNPLSHVDPTGYAGSPVTATPEDVESNMSGDCPRQSSNGNGQDGMSTEQARVCTPADTNDPTANMSYPVNGTSESATDDGGGAPAADDSSSRPGGPVTKTITDQNGDVKTVPMTQEEIDAAIAEGSAIFSDSEREHGWLPKNDEHKPLATTEECQGMLAAGVVQGLVSHEVLHAVPILGWVVAAGEAGHLVYELHESGCIRPNDPVKPFSGPVHPAGGLDSSGSYGATTFCYYPPGRNIGNSAVGEFCH
jgi:RHS repeat-associated protein